MFDADDILEGILDRALKSVGIRLGMLLGMWDGDPNRRTDGWIKSVRRLEGYNESISFKESVGFKDAEGMHDIDGGSDSRFSSRSE